jgi:hypothetical protein
VFSETSGFHVTNPTTYSMGVAVFPPGLKRLGNNSDHPALLNVGVRNSWVCIARAERDGTRAETRFRLSPKRTSPFKSVGASVQSTPGSRGVRISWIHHFRRWRESTGHPLLSPVSPSLPLPCVTVCLQVPNELYLHCPRHLFCLYKDKSISSCFS